MIFKHYALPNLQTLFLKGSREQPGLWQVGLVTKKRNSLQNCQLVFQRASASATTLIDRSKVTIVAWERITIIMKKIVTST